MLHRALDTATVVIEHTTATQFADPTLCTEWTVKDMINHLVVATRTFAIAAEQASAAPEAHTAVPASASLSPARVSAWIGLGQLTSRGRVRADPRSVWDRTAHRAIAAFEAPGVLDKVANLPFATMSVKLALDILIFDVATHATDLARATGQTMPDKELLEAVLALGHQVISPKLRRAGIFDEEQPGPADAPIEDRLLTFAGRRI
jgi:uncharacterized protein (TIGR03083 family)